MVRNFLTATLVTGTLLLSTAALAEHKAGHHGSAFDGAYLGVNGGFGFGEYDASFNEIGTTIKKHQDLDYTGGSAGVVLGFGHVFDSFYLGAEINFDGRWMDERETHRNTFGGVAQQDIFDVDSKYAYGIMLRPGFMVTDSTMIFGLIGYERNHFDITNTTKAAGVQNYRLHKTMNFDAFRFGAGAEYAFETMPNWKLRFDYTYSIMESKSMGAGLSKVSFDPDLHMFKLGIGYTF